MSNVKLISYTQPPYPMETLTDLVAYCARVSNPSNQMNKETSEKLIKYLIKHQSFIKIVELIKYCLKQFMSVRLTIAFQKKIFNMK